MLRIVEEYLGMFGILLESFGNFEDYVGYRRIV